MLKTDSLLLYKNHPARLLHMGDRLEIELENGETVRVRPKDVTLLHEGPLRNFKDLRPQDGDVDTAWEILAGARTSLAELAELIYGAFTPVTAWAAWQQVMNGWYFEGEPESIRARSADEVARRQQERSQAEAHQRAWQAFLDRIRGGSLVDEDRSFMQDVENLALGRSQRSNVLHALGQAETAENAHRLLMELGVWGVRVNPYPARLGLPLNQPDFPLPDLPEEDRLDLTGLPSFAIDDEGTDTPDDAVSLEQTPQGPRVWVHVADPAALIAPGSPLDLEARARAESLHLPEGTIHLVPRAIIQQLGLGVNETSPALSFGIGLAEDGTVRDFTIRPSRVRVTRLSYDAAETLMDTPPFSTLEQFLGAVRERRKAAGAVMLDFPEVKITALDGDVIIRPLPPLRSRMMIEEAMILAGTETARFAAGTGLRLAFSQQEPVETSQRPETLSGMFAFRRLLKRSQYHISAAPHGGLGVPAYTQVTSPLRRYLDLAGHQQIRALLSGAPLLDETEMVERIGAVEAVIGSLRRAESLSEKHWTLVYLLQHPDWRGEGILVDRRGTTGIVIIPSLGLEARVSLRADPPLDALLPLAISGVNLPQNDVFFRLT